MAPLMWLPSESPFYSFIALSSGLVIYGVLLAVYPLFFHPLRNFTGPKAAAITRWHEFYYDIYKEGVFFKQIKKMHEQYGPIVRINPDEIHIKDPDYFDNIYPSSSKKRERYPLHANICLRSIANTISHDLHRRRRKVLNPFFSKRKIIEQETLIVTNVSKLVHRLEAAIPTQKVIRLDVAYMALAMDIIGAYCFGKSFNHLDEPDFSQF
jgi:hypothetical protein